MTTNITTKEVTALAMNLAEEQISEAVAAMAPDVVVPFLVKVEEAREMLGKLKKELEIRLELAGQVGQTFTINGREYGFWGSQRKGFKDIPSLLTNLRVLGVGLPEIASAVSEMRVTDLRKSASLLSDPDNRKEALALIEEHREKKGDVGAPHLVALDYVAGGGNNDG